MYASGFIDFIVDPTFQVLGDMLDTIMAPLKEQDGDGDGEAAEGKSTNASSRPSSSASLRTSSSAPSTPVKTNKS